MKRIDSRKVSASTLKACWNIILSVKQHYTHLDLLARSNIESLQN